MVILVCYISDRDDDDAKTVLLDDDDVKTLILGDDLEYLVCDVDDELDTVSVSS